MHRYRFNLILTQELLVKITMKPELGPYQLDKLKKYIHLPGMTSFCATMLDQNSRAKTGSTQTR